MYKAFFKYIFDFVIATVFLCVAFPFMLLIAFILLFLNNGKVFFKQKRPGFKERVFTIYKFKTMNEKKDSNGFLLPDVERITAFGRFMRRFSLDELPQIFNVLSGRLSIVGPRPLLVEYLELYSDFQKRRHSVRPGITGWAQVNGRNAISWDDKFKYDVWYADNLSFWLDLKIIFKTIQKVFISDGVNANENTTMERFTGNRQNSNPIKTEV